MTKMNHKNIFICIATFICILLIVAACHHPPSQHKIKEIWHGRVHWEAESNTKMLRSAKKIIDRDKEIMVVPPVVTLTPVVTPKPVATLRSSNTIDPPNMIPSSSASKPSILLQHREDEQFCVLNNDTALLTIGNSVVGRHHNTLEALYYNLPQFTTIDARLDTGYWQNITHCTTDSKWCNAWMYQPKDSSSKSVDLFTDQGIPNLKSLTVNWSESLPASLKHKIVMIGGAQWKILSGGMQGIHRWLPTIVQGIRIIHNSCSSCQIFVFPELPTGDFWFSTTHCNAPDCHEENSTTCNGTCLSSLNEVFNAKLWKDVGEMDRVFLMDFTVSPDSQRQDVVHWNHKAILNHMYQFLETTCTNYKGFFDRYGKSVDPVIIAHPFKFGAFEISCLLLFIVIIFCGIKMV
tara:strand:- start:215 stop:1432 length:1218 start_codon:yes stop_codon:yes gene_type:complete